MGLSLIALAAFSACTDDVDVDRDTGLAGRRLSFIVSLDGEEAQTKADDSGNISVSRLLGSVRSTGDYTLPSATNTNGSWTLKDGHYASYTTRELAEPLRLTSYAQELMGDSGAAMLLPQTLTAWDRENDKRNAANGSYIALYLRITTQAGRQVYPAAKGEYGWAAVPIGGDAESKKNVWRPGDKFIYTLDFSYGAGETPPDSDDPGASILGAPISFTVTRVNLSVSQ